MFSSTFVASLPKFCPREQSCGQLCPQMNVIDALLYFSYCSVPYAALAAMFKQVLSFSAGSQNSLLSSRAHNRDGECKHFGSKIISQVEQITARLQITQIVREFFRKVIFSLHKIFWQPYVRCCSAVAEPPLMSPSLFAGVFDSE